MLMKKGNNMTFEQLNQLPRLGDGGLLDHWIQANESNDTKMIDLTMSVMCHQEGEWIASLENKTEASVATVNSEESDADRSRRLNLRRSLLG